MAFQATVITQPGASQKLSAAASVGVPSVADAPQTQKPACEPKVSVQRDGSRVTGIQILCSCGQVIDLACVYEAAAPQATAAPTATPQPATTPQAEPKAAPQKAAPGKICKDSGKDLPASAKKKPKKA